MADSSQAVPRAWQTPGLMAGASLLVPGLGQALLNARGRAATFFASVVLGFGIVWWQELWAVGSLLVFIWLWNVWDAYGLAQDTPRTLIPPVIAILVIAYTAGWIVTEIEPARLFDQAGRVQPIVEGLLTPDFVSRPTETSESRIVFEVHCSDSPPPTSRQFADGASLSLSQSCGEVDETITVTGRGFRPDDTVALWWVNPIGQVRRLIREGEHIVVPTDAEGNFSTEIRVPLAVPLTQETGEPQEHEVQVVQTEITGGWQISENGWLVINKMTETIAIALVATTFAIGLAVPLSFIAARNLMSATGVTLGVYYITRTILNVVRSIESLIIAIVFVVWVGLGPFAGVMALTVHSIAALGKLYSEQVENIDFGPIEALRASGATWPQMVAYAVVPQVLPPFLAFTLYRWDINVRMSTILGFVGGGGIGFLIVQWQRLNEWEAIGAAFWSIMLIVALLDFVSAEARKRLV